MIFEVTNLKGSLFMLSHSIANLKGNVEPMTRCFTFNELISKVKRVTYIIHCLFKGGRLCLWQGVVPETYDGGDGR